MTELEDKLNQVLSNPQMMQQILSLAQSMGVSSQQPPPPEHKDSIPIPDPGITSPLIPLATTR